MLYVEVWIVWSAQVSSFCCKVTPDLPATSIKHLISIYSEFYWVLTCHLPVNEETAHVSYDSLWALRLRCGSQSWVMAIAHCWVELSHDVCDLGTPVTKCKLCFLRLSHVVPFQWKNCPALQIFRYFYNPSSPLRPMGSIKIFWKSAQSQIRLNIRCGTHMFSCHICPFGQV